MLDRPKRGSKSQTLTPSSVRQALESAVGDPR
jgi:hypothetical protein